MADAWLFPRLLWFAARDREMPSAASRSRRAIEAHDERLSRHTSDTPCIGGVPAVDLVTRLQADDRHALGFLYTELADTLIRLAVVRTRSVETAKEIVHDVFLSLWVHRGALQRTTDFRVYLAAAVRNRTRNLWAHDAVVASVERDVERETLDAPAIGHAGATPDVNAEAAEFHRAYREALRALTERERAAALLRWEERMTFDQIGRVLGVSTVGARAIILRAQRKVQAGLAKYRG